jgi:pimeloyl-ACP methyl ester carboxylesterase
MKPVITLWNGVIRDNVHVTIDVLESRAGLLPELLGGPASSTVGRNLIIFYPGNPGVVNFYLDFVALLAAKAVDVIVMGFAGHSLHELNGGQYFTLQDQLELAHQFTGRVLSKPVISRYKSCNLGGHSIGSFVALHMCARFADVSRAFMLTPTICNMKLSPNGTRNGKFLKPWLIHTVCSTVLPLFEMMPQRVKIAAVQLAQNELDGQQRWITTKMGRPSMIRNLLFLARSEFEQVATLDVELLAAHQERLILYFVKHDGWVPLDDVDLIRQHAPAAHALIVEENEKVAHAWCLHFNANVVEAAVLPFLP